MNGYTLCDPSRPSSFWRTFRYTFPGKVQSACNTRKMIFTWTKTSLHLSLQPETAKVYPGKYNVNYVGWRSPLRLPCGYFWYMYHGHTATSVHVTWIETSIKDERWRERVSGAVPWALCCPMLLRSALDIYTCPFGADDGTCPFSTSIKADPVVMVDFSSRLLLPGRGTVTHSTSSQTCCCHSKVQTECCPFHLAFVYTFRSGISLTPLFFVFLLLLLSKR
jgi:hypothetical protein